MKALKSLTLLLILTFVLACSDDDSDDSNNTIIGTWQLVSESLTNGETLQLDLCRSMNTFQFNETTLIVSNFFLFEGECEEGLTETSEYELNGNILTIIPEFGSPFSPEVEITNTTLTIFGLEGIISVLERQ